jgi:hypothetical protein
MTTTGMTTTGMTATRRAAAEVPAAGMPAARKTAPGMPAAGTEPATSAATPPTTVEERKAIIWIDVDWRPVEKRQRDTPVRWIIVVSVGALDTPI